MICICVDYEVVNQWLRGFPILVLVSRGTVFAVFASPKDRKTLSCEQIFLNL